MADSPLVQVARAALLRPGSDDARLRLYEALSAAELALPVAGDQGEEVEPETVEVAGVPHVVAYDGVAGIAGGEARPTAAMSGLALARMLQGQGVGVLLRLPGLPDVQVAPEALDWLAESLGQGPEAREARPLALHPPKGLPGPLLLALDRRLAQAEGLAAAAWLVLADWSDGTRGHLLAVVGARPGVEEVLAAGINAAVALSGAEGVRMDVTFIPEGAPVLDRFARVGLRFDLQSPMEPPTGPPRLR